MTEKIVKHTLPIAMALLFLTITGCGVKITSKNNTMRDPKSGISMKIPSDWVLDNSRMCHKGEYNTGALMEDSLGGKDFAEAVDKISKEFGAKILSKKNFEINGYKAIKAHIEAPNGVNSLRIYIHKKDKIISVSFAIESKEMYSKYESALLKSVKTIKFK